MASQSESSSSALAGVYGEMIGEFFGTMILILFGDGVVATVFLYGNLGANGGASPFATEWIVIILGWGLAVMLGIYVAGAISGAHINPAVTLALAASGRFSWGKVPLYWLSQIAGAFVAGGILYFVYQGALVHALALNHLNIGDIAQGPTFGGKGYGFIFYTGVRNFVGIFGAFGDEFMGTALLVGMILAIVDTRNSPPGSNLNPLIIGLLVVAIGASFGLNTGYAINPARDFGPRLWIALVSGGTSFVVDNYYFWIPIVAPLTGGVAGAFIFDFTIGKVLAAKKLGPSGTTVTTGESVREVAHD